MPIILTCSICGKHFSVRPSHARRRRWCSNACSAAGRRVPIAERLWRRVERSADGCWLWRGRRGTNGYGMLIGPAPGRWYLAVHRVSYELAYGTIEPGKYVLHRCDVKLCVRPDHLTLGTQLENVRDAVVKGIFRPGHVVGSQQGRSKLTEADIPLLRAMWRAGFTYKEITQRFGISEALVSNVLKGRNWTHVVDDD